MPGIIFDRLKRLAKSGISRAFTLIEVLLVVAVLSIIAGVGVTVISNTREATRVSKLNSDVATINAAIAVYQSSGGSLGSLSNAQAILDKLKTTASAPSAQEIAGFRGSVVDSRLTARMQTSEEAASGNERAVWDASAQRFVVTTSGAGGVREFLLDDSAGIQDYGTEVRETANARGTNNAWVWDYQDVAAVSPTGPQAPGTGTAGASEAPTSPTAQTLSAPNYSLPEGSYALSNYDLAITLSDPNPPGVAQVWYNNGGGFVRYNGAPIVVAPGESIRAVARTIDPDRWSNSNENEGTWMAIPFQPAVQISAPVSTMTYAEAGGAMTSGDVITPGKASISISNFAEIPEKYRSSGKFQVYYTLDGSSPLTAGVAGPDFSTTYVSPQIDVSVANWGSSSSLTISAAARALDTSMFANSAVSTTTLGITQTVLASPTIDPPSGSKAVDLPVSIALAAGQNYPVGARIYYTINGTDPGNVGGNPASGTLYEGQFNSGAGTDGVVVVTARVYGPSGYGQWFTPSPAATTTYATITLADGALVGSATLNGTFVGSLVYASPPTGGTMNNITFNSNARIMNGNLYLPGTPTVRRTNGTIWSVANDSQFSANILGWEFDSSGAKTVQTTPRVLNENGSVTPDNYTVTFNNSAVLEGKVIRRHNSPAFPTIAPPPAADSNASTSLNSPPSGPISASTYSTVTLNSSAVGEVRLNAGHFKNLTANNGTAFVLGDPANPEVTQYYSFESLTLNSSSDLKIVGKVIVTVGGSININSGSVLGNADHPEWFQLQFSSGSLTANSGSTIYGQLVNPTGSVIFNAGSTFTGSVTAQSLTINSSSIVFNLPPVIQN